MKRFRCSSRCFFVGASHDDLKDFPPEVQGEIGYALHEAQLSLRPYKAKVLRGFGRRERAGRGATIISATPTARFMP